MKYSVGSHDPHFKGALNYAAGKPKNASTGELTAVLHCHGQSVRFEKQVSNLISPLSETIVEHLVLQP